MSAALDKQVRAAAWLAAMADAAQQRKQRDTYFSQLLEELNARSWIMSTQPS